MMGKRRGRYVLLSRDNTFSLFHVTDQTECIAFNLPYDALLEALTPLRSKTVHLVEGGEALTLEHCVLPPLFFWDRMRFVAHKKSLIAGPFNAQWIANRRPFFGPCEGVLVRMSHAPSIAKTLDIFNVLGITLGDMTSLPLIGFTKEKKVQTGNMLLAWQNSDTSLSQVFTRNKLPLMTRLTPPLGKATTIPKEMDSFSDFLAHHRHVEGAIAHHILEDTKPFDHDLIAWWTRYRRSAARFTLAGKDPALSSTHKNYLSRGLAAVLSLWIAVSSYSVYDLYQDNQNLLHIQTTLQKQAVPAVMDDAVLENNKPLLAFYLEKTKEIDGFWDHLHTLGNVVVERIKIQQVQWIKDSSNKTTLALHVASVRKDQDTQVRDFEAYVDHIKTSFHASNVTVMKAPFNAHPNQLFEGGPGYTASNSTVHEGIIQVGFSHEK